MKTCTELMDECKDELLSLDEDIHQESEYILIISNDNYTCRIKKKNTYISDFLKGMYEGDSDAGKLGTEIHLNKLSGNILRLIEEYMNHHEGEDNDIPNMPLEDTDMAKILKDNWDVEFLDRICPTIISRDDSSEEEIPDLRGLIELLTISNYLGMNTLLHKLSAKFASFMRNKSEEEISRFLAHYANQNN
jgi:hypothetical protein